mmetsp:Transcript_44947/g.74976  ORF Transcript_44947/g.74976 Transcript_44947/m.74976 type:complete len:285 (+) Transcript_44947:44-898(+)|eukprot:jgi/Bigna1/80137/fgenesh1_pg.68_\
MEGKSMEVYVKTMSGDKKRIEVPFSATVGVLKQTYEEKTKIPKDQQKYWYEGTFLENDSALLLSTYKVESGSELMLLISKPENWFCVVKKNSGLVIGPFKELSEAKKELNKSRGGANNQQMICEMSQTGAKDDPHTVGGENQGAGAPGGFEKWWYGWAEIKQMNTMANKWAKKQGLIIDNPFLEKYYFVVNASTKKVKGPYKNVLEAQKVLNEHKGGPSNRQMVAVLNEKGESKSDPHTIGGLNQGAGEAGGFNKWWSGWGDIVHMNRMATDTWKQMQEEENPS